MSLQIHVSELPCRIYEIQYSVDMKSYDRLLSFLAFNEAQALLTVLKSVLRQHCRAAGLLEDREVLLNVLIPVGPLGSEPVAREPKFSLSVETVGKIVA